MCTHACIWTHSPYLWGLMESGKELKKLVLVCHKLELPLLCIWAMHGKACSNPASD